MKNVLCLTVCALSLLAFASTAHSGGAEASATFTFDLGTATGAVDFNGVIKNDGTVKGQMSLTANLDVGAEVCTVFVNPDHPELGCLVSEPADGTTSTPVALGFQIDCMLVHVNRAVMSGTVTTPVDSPLVGQHAILAVEANVPGTSPASDAFVWGVYKPKFKNASATDYDFCPFQALDGGYNRDPDDCDGPCPITVDCLFDGNTTGEITDARTRATSTPGNSLTWAAKDYELCPYPPPDDNGNNVPEDLVQYLLNCPDPNAFTEGIPVTPTLVSCDPGIVAGVAQFISFPLSSYPLNLILHGGGNNVNVKDNS